ncbi:hypothetical protein PIB30_048721 [Stylosanthes scabra]|uniref:Uncharacterized protein n=1 Tax=Stylosanthes scabra TaxID=79078 RepID=A0ABU6WH19_9FABA|nr:hypothetical protein [Stylosanthes scabra]
MGYWPISGLRRSHNNNSPLTHLLSSDVVLKCNKSTATPRSDAKFFNNDEILIQHFTPRKRNGFWTFLYLSSSSIKKLDANNNNAATARLFATTSSATTTATPLVGVQENTDDHGITLSEE